MSNRPNQIKHAHRQGHIALGVNAQMASPEVIEMVGIAGYDFVMIDWEHGAFGFETVVSMIRAAEAVQLTPIVRIPEVNAAVIKKVLDAGAMGIVVPQVATVEEARIATSGVRYADGRNQGNRGACPSTRATGHLVADWREFYESANSEIYLAISIECQEGLRNFEAMAALGGIDAVFLGVFDLSQSMGHHGDMKHPAVLKALDGLLETARRLHIPVHATLVARNGQEASLDMAYWTERGATTINTISDRRLVSVGLRDHLQALR
jgi:4-hydroxy-2-oxoheptanedioate aldolase